MPTTQPAMPPKAAQTLLQRDTNERASSPPRPRALGRPWAVGLPAWAIAVLGLLLLGVAGLAWLRLASPPAAHADPHRVAALTGIEQVWRCKHLRDAGDRDSCLAQLGPAAVAIPSQTAGAGGVQPRP
jgi:hypothetical protein